MCAILVASAFGYASLNQVCAILAASASVCVTVLQGGTSSTPLPLLCDLVEAPRPLQPACVCLVSRWEPPRPLQAACVCLVAR